LTNEVFSSSKSQILRKPLTATPSPTPTTASRRPAQKIRGLSAAPPEPRDVLNSMKAVIYDWDLLSDEITWGSNVGEVLCGFDPCALESGDAFADLVAPQSECTRHQSILHGGNPDGGDGAHYRAQYGLVKATGESIAVEDFGRWFADASGRPARAHGVMRVIPDRPDCDAQRAALARDQLTGAFGRGRLVEHINDRFARAPRDQAQFAVMLVGVDQLVAINQHYGYDAADQVLMIVAARLRASVRAADLLARYVGGKFVLVIDRCGADEFALLSRRILQTVSSAPVLVDGRSIEVSLMIGASLAPRHGRSAQALLQRAEEAYEFACRGDGGRIALFTATFASRGGEARASSICEEIVAALNDRRVVVAYQPVVPTRPDKPLYYEALVRIRDGAGELAGPAAILPIAEKSGLIAQVDQRVLELVLRRLVAEPDLRIAVNTSPATILEPDWVDRFAGALAAHPGAADRLIVEVTESLAIRDLEKTARILAQVKTLGVRIAMDDFGAGHTSFRNLRGLGVDIVKIDGAFIQNITRSADDRFFVRTLVDLAHHLGVETVAEWVEGDEAARILAEWGVDYLQGHHFGIAEALDETAPAPAPAAHVA
jgi:diguanylate cyclase (GGDEF)-like protein